MSKKQDILVRGIKLVTVLAPAIQGMTTSELAQKTGLSLAVVCRDLASLREVGWVSKDDNRWTLTHKPIALAHACELAFQTISDRHNDFRHNVKAGALRILGGANG